MTKTMGRFGQDWLVYMILCSDNSLYTGITNDLPRRLRQHAEGSGAKYFRGRMPGPVVYLEAGHSRSTASRRESEIKKYSPDRKRALIASAQNRLELP